MTHAVVTGATNGIGEAIARRLAEEGLTVTVVGRSDERLMATQRRIDDAAPGADVKLERADLAELKEVRALAERILAGPLPEVVISNAALVTGLDRKNSEGLPRVLAVNHLAPYVLLRTLAANLERARLIVVGADPVFLAQMPVDLDDILLNHPERLGEPAGVRPFFAYCQTKNMNAMFVFELARRMGGTGITVNGVHPGFIGGTGLGGEVPTLAAAMGEALQSGALSQPGPQPGERGPQAWTDPDNAPSPDDGADTPVWLATAAEVEGVTGRFYVDRAVVQTAPHTTDVERCGRLWNESARLVGLPA